MDLFRSLHGKMHIRKRKTRAVSGFSLAEVLIVVAIIIILLAVVAPAIMYYRNLLKQRSLDEKAQIIYIAAQNQLALLELEGRQNEYAKDAPGVHVTKYVNGLTPSDYVKPSDSTKFPNLHYMSYAEKGLSAVKAVMGADAFYGTTDDELYSKRWIIEYNPLNATVYAVFYNENNDRLSDYEGRQDYYDTLRKSSKDRIKDGIKVGYYGGDITVADVSIKFIPSIEIINEELLYAKLNCISSGVPIYYEVTLQDTKGHKYIEKLKPRISDKLNTYVLTLDDLASQGTRFNDLYGSGSSHSDSEKLVAGTDITISVSVHAQDAAVDATSVSETASASTNSLFADKDHYSVVMKDVVGEDTAVIQYARHLQNLDTLSGVGNNIKQAIQINNIDFLAKKPAGSTDRATKYFYTSYSTSTHGDTKNFSAGIHLFGTAGTTHSTIFYNGMILREGVKVPNFKPIYNPYLTSYVGTYTNNSNEKVFNHSISGLSILTGSAVSSSKNANLKSAGLFEKVEKTADNAGKFKIEGIDVIDAAVFATDGAASAGAVFGEIANGASVEVKQVRVRLSDEVYNANPEISKEENIWIGAENAGGLVGKNAGSLSTEYSFAASVVGKALTSSKEVLKPESGSIAIATKSGGGLVGKNSGNVSVNKSYADNYLAGNKVGGFVGESSGNGVNIENSYAAGFAYGFDSSTTVSNAASIVNNSCMAGMVVGQAGSVKNSYTILAPLESKKRTGRTNYVLSTCSGIGTVSKVYYLIGSSFNMGTGTSPAEFAGVKSIESVSKNELFTALGSAYTNVFSDTEAYNLMKQKLVSYSYPRIADPAGQEHYMAHCNDWSDSFRTGALVYYEVYTRTFAEVNDWKAKNPAYTDAELLKYINEGPISYGFSGGNLHALKNDRVVIGDGYGVVFRESDLVGATAKPDIPDTIKVTVTDSVAQTKIAEETIKIKNLTVTDKKSYLVTADTPIISGPLAGTMEQVNYSVFPLSVKTVNTSKALSVYYQAVKISSADASAGSQGSYYYYNPHMGDSAVAVMSESSPAPVVGRGTRIAVRTPRHLLGMSLYYNTYVAATERAVYSQELEIDYKYYDWSNFYVNKSGTVVSTISEQKPIGAGGARNGSGEKSFAATYDGGRNEIRNISFKADDNGEYVGLFGANRGTIKNVFLPADYYANNNQKNTYAVLSQVIGQNVKAYMGSLVGFNDTSGIIDNCATAGIVLGNNQGLISAYTNSAVYAGGFVGMNKGSITNSSADSPMLQLNMNYSEDYLGGFAGYNAGSISNCYGVGVLKTLMTRGGKVKLGGFAGDNTGYINSSYCTTGIVGGGDTTSVHAFTWGSGSAANCEYLNGETLDYVNQTYSYNYETSKSYGSPKKMGELSNTGDKATAERSLYHINTASNGAEYPYRAVVKNKDGNFVHYGEWQDNQLMGMVGLFYWEHEKGDSTDGYRYTFLGLKGEDGLNRTIVKGTSLNTTHDSKTRITEYGYGYYALQNTMREFKVQRLANIDLSSGTFNVNAKAELEKQMKGYDVYPYTTKPDKSGDYITFTGGASGNNCVTNGQIVLRCQENFGGDNDGRWTEIYYTVSPFFANAMSMDRYRTTPKGKALWHRDVTTLGMDISVAASDGTATNYAKKPGETLDNAYEIRSVQQLQFINWNYDSKNNKTNIGSCNVEVNAGNYTKFNYLMQTNVTGIGKQTRGEAYNNSYKYWKQTLDIDGSNFVGYTPIAAPATSSGYGAYNATLYAWFGNDYDGQSYKIKNLNINSKAFAVGLFGVTAGANLKNIILYGDGAVLPVIERNTSTTPGAYSIGGLVGVAIDYQDGMGRSIENCAIAGYIIKDNSHNAMTLGEVNIGGLIGVANLNLLRCSAVADIKINCTSPRKAAYGDFVRCGMIAGGNKGTVSDCFSGGSISVDRATLDETYNKNGVKVGVGTSAPVDKQKSTNIFLGGISGSAFTITYQNFEGHTSVQDGKPVFKNCYTYVEFPKMEGTIRAISMIGALADRFSVNNLLPKYYNCFYFDRSAKIELDIPKYYFEEHGTAKSLLTKDIMTNPDSTGTTIYKKMLMGNLDYMNTYYWGGSADKPYNTDAYFGLTELTYSKMASRKNDASIKIIKNPLDSVPATSPYPYDTEFKDFASAINVDTSGGTPVNRTVWTYVTNVENGQAIEGKYSFPGGVPSIESKDYPFASVIRQKDLLKLSGNTELNVHYGRWPNGSVYWSEAMASMDIFSDMDTVKESSPGISNPLYGFAVKTFVLNDLVGMLPKEDLPVAEYFDVSPAGYADIIDAKYDSVQNVYNVRVRALIPQSVTITEKKLSNASFNLGISGEFNASVEPKEIVYDLTGGTIQNTPHTLNLSAKNMKDEELKTKENLGIYVYTDSDEEGLKFTASKDGSDILLGTAQLPINADNVVVKLDNYIAGKRCSLKTEAFYSYPAKEELGTPGFTPVMSDGKTYTVTRIFGSMDPLPNLTNVTSYGFVGLLARKDLGGGERLYSVKEIRKATGDISVEFVSDINILKDVANLVPSDFDNASLPEFISSGNDIYIYATKGDNLLSEMDITEITVTDTSSNIHTFTRNSDGSYASSVTSDTITLDGLTDAKHAITGTELNYQYQKVNCIIGGSAVDINSISAIKIKCVPKP